MFGLLLHFVIPAAMVLAGQVIKHHCGKGWRSCAAGAMEELGILAAVITAMVDLLSMTPAFAAVRTGPVALGAGLTALAAALCLVRYAQNGAQPPAPSHPVFSKRYPLPR